MKNRAWLVCAVLCLLAPAALLAQQAVTATGTAAILNKDVAQARDRAVESALRSAVERVVGTMVDSESLVKNNDLISDKIFTQTRGYISDYKILSEKPDMDSNIYSVSVEATVKEGNLADDLNSLGLLLRRMKMPRVAVALDEEGDAASANVLRMLKDKGFLVVDTGERASDRNFWTMSMPQQADLMKRYGAEVVILGSAKGEQGGPVTRGSNLRSYQASVSLKAVKTDTHEVMGTASGSGTAVHLGEAGVAQALKQASTVAGNDIIRQITKQWEAEATSTRILTLILKGLSAEEAEKLAHRLQTEGRGIQDVMVRNSGAGESTLNVSMQGDASALEQEVAKLYPKLRVVSKSANSLTVSR